MKTVNLWRAARGWLHLDPILPVTPGFVDPHLSMTSNLLLSTVTFTWTAGSDGAVPDGPVESTIIAAIAGLSIIGAETIPGSPNPTLHYNAEVQDGAGADVFGGALHSRSATAAEIAKPAVGSWPVTDTLTFKVSGNSVNGAKGTVTLFLSRQR